MISEVQTTNKSESVVESKWSNEDLVSAPGDCSFGHLLPLEGGKYRVPSEHGQAQQSRMVEATFRRTGGQWSHLTGDQYSS